LWAKKAGFEIIHVDAYHPHYVTGEHRGFWSWTLRAVALGLVKEGSLTAARLEELVAGMNETDASPDTLVAHCRMHQLIAKKPDMRVSAQAAVSRRNANSNGCPAAGLQRECENAVSC
jgi:hypothetical protein